MYYVIHASLLFSVLVADAFSHDFGWRLADAFSHDFGWRLFAVEAFVGFGEVFPEKLHVFMELLGGKGHLQAFLVENYEALLGRHNRFFKQLFKLCLCFRLLFLDSLHHVI